MAKTLMNAPKIGDKIQLSVLGKPVTLKVVERTSCKDCYLYGKVENKYSVMKCNCFNFQGNKQDVWIECSGSYRPDKTNIMFIK